MKIIIKDTNNSMKYRHEKNGTEWTNGGRKYDYKRRPSNKSPLPNVQDITNTNNKAAHVSQSNRFLLEAPYLGPLPPSLVNTWWYAIDSLSKLITLAYSSICLTANRKLMRTDRFERNKQ